MRRFKTFKITETMISQIDSLPENMQLKYYKALCKYGLDEIDPNFEGIEQAIWIPMRDMIEFHHSLSRVAQENGKQGGAPKGNKNRTVVDPLTEAINKSMPDDMKIDNETAREFIGSGIDPSWFNQPYSFLDMVLERVNEKYGSKPISERKTIFITAVKKWTELREEYLSWKLKKEKKEEKQIKVQELENIKNKKPVRCVCGGVELVEGYDSIKCKKCHAICQFNNVLMKWEWDSRR